MNLAHTPSIPVSITCPVDRSNAAISAMYSSGPADIATVHFDRNLGSADGHWGPVIDCWRVADLYPGVPPISSNEPIGSGSSVSTEDHPNHLCAAGVFAWIANLPMYVYHSRAGTSAIDAGGNPVAFEQTAGFSAYQYLRDIVPPDVASWIRNDGKESAAPFTAYSMGQANKYWTDVGGATNGCHRNIGGRKGIEFICFTQGVLGGGVTLEARQQLTFRVYDPLTGAVVMDTTTKNTGEQINLAMGNEIYIIKGAYGASLPGGGSKTLNSRGAAAITIDGATGDWNLSEFTTKIRGGQAGEGDTALVGWDGGSLYYGSYGGVLPTSASDHTAKVYSRNNASYLYFLVRCDDNDIRYPNAVDMNWANDCVEFYIDPANDGGSAPMSNSTSDVQLVIDANNQKNVYTTTGGYATQILNGVTSQVVRDASGWWLEARISKTALDPDLVTGNTFGLDFNFRDNDNNNDAALTTIYTWNDASYIGFPSKVPNNWGDCFLDATQTPFSGVIAIPGTIQAENYDVGGQNISFYDTTPGNGGAVYRSDDVDIEPAADTGGGYNIGWVENGEWMEYTINVAGSGDYSIKFRVAGGPSGGSFRARLDGADLTGLKSCADTGGFQNWTTIIAPARYMAAGQHILRFCHEGNQANINYIDIASNGADAVSQDLGASNSDDGMGHAQGGDGDTTAATIGGHYCRGNVNPAQDFYMYFSVVDAYAYQGNKPTLAITIDYYDTGTGSLTLHYDATSSPYKVGATAYLTNTNTWKTYTWQINDAYFGNRQNGASDFRIAADVGQTFYLDTVAVYPGVADTTPPGNVTGFTATPGDNQNILSWTNPTDLDFIGVKIMFKTTGYPTGPTDGTQCYDAGGTSYNHTALINGTTYYYKAFAHDAAPNYASGVQASATPVDTSPPVNVTNFTATPGDGQVSLSWTNPAGGFTGIKIRFKTTGYPTGPADGTQIYDSNGTSYNHTGLTNGTTYYYTAFAHDEVPNYASGAQASAVPTGPVTISNSTFVTTADGWTITLWKNGESFGTMQWTSGAGNPGGAIRTSGVGATDSGDTCTREGGNLTKTISTVGYHGIQVAYDLRVNTLGGNYTGSGAGACVVDHSVVDEQLTVSYSTNGGSTWTEAEYLLRAALLASYQTYGRRTIDLSAITGCDNNAGFALKFRWQVNTATDLCDLDNITVSGLSDADITPPGQVTGFSATSGAGQNTLAWTNPGNSDFLGTIVRYKTTGYPTSATDGTLVCNRTAAPGSTDSYAHAGLTNGVRCYYAAFAYDEVPNYASATTANAVPAADATIPAAKALADGQVRALRGNVVSAVIGSSLYVQDPVKPWGIKVIGVSASPGQKVDIVGVMGGQSGERYIDCAGNPVTVVDPGPIALGVRTLGARALGGAGISPLPLGVYGGEGANNLCLLVGVCGEVTQRDRFLQFFYIDDGAGLLDGTQTETSPGVFEPSVGVRIKADPTAYPAGSYIAVTGISSCFADGGALKRQVLPITGGVRILKP
ncbi:MAG: carbohydrate-binding protein [Armatimonadota bacterium]|nr:carbohydrate-binding protein [Armatimonadota bacterium]